MNAARLLAIGLTMLAAGCSNGTQNIPTLATGEERLAADGSPATVLRVADATRASGDAATAIGLYRRAHQLAPSDPLPLARLGSTLAELRDYTEAAEAFRQAADLAPKDVEVRRGYAAVLLSIGKPELAITHLDAALAQRKEPRLYSLLGVANDLLGRHDVAQQNYAEGLRLAPDSLPLRNNLGLSQALAGDYSSAVLTLSAAAGGPKATARTRQNLALAYGLSGDNDKAAAVGRTDLDEESVKSNLAYYAMLRGLSDHARAAAIIGARSVAPSPNASGAPDVPEAAAPPSAPEVKVAATQPASPDRSVEAAPLTEPSPSAAPAVKTAARKPVHAPRRLTPPIPVPAVAQAETPPAPASAASETPPTPAAPETQIEIGKAEDPVTAEPTPRQEAAAAPAKPEEPAQAVLPDDAAASQIAAQFGGEAPRVAAPRPAPPIGATATTPLKRRSYFVQVGAFKDAVRAHKLCDGLVAKGYDLTVAPSHGDPTRDLFLCRSSEPAGRTDAAAVAQHLRDGESTPALLVPTTEN